MARKGSQSRTCAEADIGAARLFSIPLFPALLGVLAVLNVASVVLVLVE